MGGGVPQGLDGDGALELDGQAYPVEPRSPTSGKTLNFHNVTRAASFDRNDIPFLGACPQHYVLSWLNMSPDPASPSFEALHRHFPGALPGLAVHARVSNELEQFGCSSENTIFGSSICPDELNNKKGGLADVMKDHWGECFPLGGISGAAFSGKTGFKAFASHVPDDGSLLILFGPHVAISETGEVGKFLRTGQKCHSTACGAVIGAYQCCLGGNYDHDDFDSGDLQMSWVKAQLAPHAKRVQQQECPMAALAFQAYEMVKGQLETIVNTDFGRGRVVLVGGIQINLPVPCGDHFLPLMFEVRSRDQPPEDCMAAFKMTPPASSQSPQPLHQEGHNGAFRSKL